MTVNSCCHRDYSIRGTEIQVKMFDDRLVFEIPGTLPGNVKPDNIRHTHFSRNPHIAQFLKAYKYVKEFGEGVDRMSREMEEADMQPPVYHLDAFILKATLRTGDDSGNILSDPLSDPLSKDLREDINRLSDANIMRLVRLMPDVFLERKELMALCGLKDKKYFMEHYIRPALAAGVIERLYPDRPTAPGQKYRLTEKGRAAAGKR